MEERCCGTNRWAERRREREDVCASSVLPRPVARLPRSTGMAPSSARWLFLALSCAAVLGDAGSLTTRTLTPATGASAWRAVTERMERLKRTGRRRMRITVDGAEVEFTAPLVTLTYAQSLDGSIAAADGSAVLLSGKESMHMTHTLRAAHDAILVGVGTVRNDDPSLTVRLCAGSNPQPVVLDSRLSIAASLDIKLLSSDSCERPWIMCLPMAHRNTTAVRGLEDAGATVVTCSAGADGRVALERVLWELSERNVTSLMVEGGAAVIQSFLRQGLADLCVVTIAPRFQGGLNVLASTSSRARAAGLDRARTIAPIAQGQGDGGGKRQARLRGARGGGRVLPPSGGRCGCAFRVA
ncbi:dihydrofolate reductase-like domain-containing protein [Baffinella frigidus]|nr:dihydrofolate reductase-like domain-containing protein [Cryptophyta sp. CCMP2293]